MVTNGEKFLLLPRCTLEIGPLQAVTDGKPHVSDGFYPVYNGL